jgi:hypothetical protein
MNKDGSFKNIIVNLFYSDENGIRLSTGNDEPRTIKKDEIIDNNELLE